MPRPVKIRVSYRDDASFLLRLEAAVVRDDRRPEEWKTETAGMIRQLAMRLLDAEKTTQTSGPCKESRKKVAGS